MIYIWMIYKQNKVKECNVNVHTIEIIKHRLTQFMWCFNKNQMKQKSENKEWSKKAKIKNDV